jgi:hypothetical protein
VFPLIVSSEHTTFHRQNLGSSAGAGALRVGVAPHAPTWIFDSDWKSPNKFRSHRTTAMTTTPLRIDLIDACIGIKRFTSHSRTPTTMRTVTT